MGIFPWRGRGAPLCTIWEFRHGVMDLQGAPPLVTCTLQLQNIFQSVASCCKIENNLILWIGVTSVTGEDQLDIYLDMTDHIMTGQLFACCVSDSKCLKE